MTTPLAVFTRKCFKEISSVDKLLPELLINLNGKINSHRLKKKLKELGIAFKSGKCSVETNLWFLTLYLIKRPLFRGEHWSHFEMVFDLNEMSKDAGGVIQKTKLEKLGSGATATVYQLRIGSQNLALKCMTNDKTKETARKHEIDILNKIHSSISNSETIPKVWDWWFSRQNFYILMDDGGQPLTNRKALSDPQILHSIALQLFQGLNVMHTAGFVHRDIKPANILYRLHPVTQCVKITYVDFGLAFDLNAETRVKGLCGTPNFLGYWMWMLEYRTGDNYGPSYIAADIWAVFATLLNLITGTTPMSGKIETTLKWQKFINEHSEQEIRDYIGRIGQTTKQNILTVDLLNWVCANLNLHRNQNSISSILEALNNLPSSIPTLSSSPSISNSPVDLTEPLN